MKQILCTFQVECPDNVSSLQVAELVGRMLDIGVEEFESLDDETNDEEVQREAEQVLALKIGEVTASDAASPPPEKFAQLSWSVGDVRSLGQFSSDAAARDWLASNQRRIRDRLCELGHEVIADLLAYDGITPADPDAVDEEE